MSGLDRTPAYHPDLWTIRPWGQTAHPVGRIVHGSPGPLGEGADRGYPLGEKTRLTSRRKAFYRSSKGFRRRFIVDSLCSWKS